VVAFFSAQSHLTVAPFAKIALAFEAIGCLDAYANDFGIDWSPSVSQRFNALAITMAVFCNREVRAEKMIVSRSVSETDSGRTISSHRRTVLMAGRSAAGGRKSG
jgi:hypothetical protein